MAKRLNAVATQAAINDIRVDLQTHILAAQESLAAAREADASSARRIYDLEQEIERLKDWKNDQKRYELKNIDPRCVAYLLKPGMENGEASHWLCTNCFDDTHKSHLQFQKNVEGIGTARAIYKCNRCKGELSVEWFYYPTKPWVRPVQA